MNALTTAIIVAAGKATRFGAPKVLIPIRGIPAIGHIVRTFQSAPSIDQIVVVVSTELSAKVEGALAELATLPPIRLVPGGKRRQDSVLAGLEVSAGSEIVVIHDGARPLVTVELIEACIAAILNGADAVIAAIPVTDTIKRVTDGVIETVDRVNLWRAQTPQAFRHDLLATELKRARQDSTEVTDESTLIERAGGRVTLVHGADSNLKLTGPGDLALVEATMRAESPTPPSTVRTGIGYDVHRIVSGRALVLGGVEISSSFGLDGHSDADVLLHAIADALLGACALGDIGQHFPPTDARYLGISSLILLDRVRVLLEEGDYAIINVDATMIAEQPRLAPHIAEMRRAIGAALRVSPEQVGIKATTNEGIGFAGRGEGIAAMAIATVRKVW